MVRVKICGVTSPAEAIAAIEAGADAIGLNYHPASPRFVGGQGPAIARALPPFVVRVGVFVDAPFDALERARADVHLVQLHGAESPDEPRFQAWKVLRALRLRTPADLDALAAWDRVAEPRPNLQGFILDGAGRPGVFGGETFDWSLFLEARRRTARPLVLAGGLTPENVYDAVRATQPDGVDVASGVESDPGRKDPAKMRAFIDAVRAAAKE